MKNVLRGAAVGTAAALVAAFGVSIAAWQVSGQNADATNNGKATKSVPLVVTAGDVTQEAYPTLVDEQTVTVTNNNKFKVQLTGVSLYITSSSQPCQSDLQRYYGTTYSVSQLPALQKLSSGASQTFTPAVTFSNEFPQTCEDQPLTFAWTAAGGSEG